MPRLALLFSVQYLNFTYQRTVDIAEEVHILGNPRYTIVAEDMQKIPEDERDKVIGFEIMAMDYLAGDIAPCYKYYTLQTTWAITTPQILTEFMSYVETQEPLWVLTATEQTETELDNILDEKYELQFSNPYVCFYRLAE